MKICGFQKTTLLDYPGHVAATVFTGGCNFRCPFCHNAELLSMDLEAEFSEDEVLDALKKRSRILEGICITGGEPTLQPDLKEFILKVRSLGLSVKLDSNGTKPDVIKSLISEGLIDYIAMDIKSGITNYGKVAGADGLIMKPILESIEYIKKGIIPYEFRTTVVKPLHSEKDFVEIADMINGCSDYYLQCYKDSDNVLESGFSAYTKEELTAFMDIVRPYAGHVELRGVDY